MHGTNLEIGIDPWQFCACVLICWDQGPQACFRPIQRQCDSPTRNTLFANLSDGDNIQLLKRVKHSMHHLFGNVQAYVTHTQALNPTALTVKLLSPRICQLMSEDELRPIYPMARVLIRLLAAV